MLAIAKTFTLDGISARPVSVEVDVHSGLPAFTIVGLPDAAVREARERVRSALVNCGFEFPMRRIIVNLAPANLRKAGPGLDLAIATALLAASEQLDWAALPRTAMAGELALDGSVRAVPGALAMAEAARADADVDAIVIPAVNGAEAALAADVGVIPLESLSQLPPLATGNWVPQRPQSLPLVLTAEGQDAPDLADLRGQQELRRALEISAAGGHSLLMIGPPGAGKSLAARRLPSILPPLIYEEALEVARIASVCGRLNGKPVGARPLRAPHHTVTAAGLVGGGNPPQPGEVTLAHHGVLFLDEFCEFSRDSLEALRDPLESGAVTIARSTAWREFPCRFMLIVAANPCPCGRGDDDADCSCSPIAVQRYQARLSGALADRIDIRVGVRQPTAQEISGEPGEPSAQVRDRVAAARERQEHRLGRGRFNAEMTPAEARACPLDESAAALLSESYARWRLSGRAHDRILRLAQSIADLAAAPRIDVEAMALALQLRASIPVE
jgi:magnesium chelatase family protein